MKQHFCALLFCFAIAGTSHAQSQSPVVEAHIEKGILLYEKGNYAEALEQYEEALKLEKKSPEANYEMALTYFAMKDLPKAISYSDKVIKQKLAGPELKAQAHVNKGSALDISGKPEQAIKEYQKAIKLAPSHYIAYYNLGLTLYNQKNYRTAEKALTKAVQLNRGHSSSHLLLGYTMQAQKQRVPALLALYHFLLLEPSTERAVTAFDVLQQLQQEGVTQAGNSVNITLSADQITDNSFSAAELMLSMTQAANKAEAKEDKTSGQLFYENTRSFFSVLGEMQKDQQDFWWDYYVEFFSEMLRDKNVEAFSYYISQSESKESEEWLKQHPQQVEKLASWYKNYKR